MEIPTAALPYLGRGLSPSLFQLSALEKAESGGRLPVEVAFSGRRPAIPGLTITRSGAGRAAGYLTAASAREFGAALCASTPPTTPRGRYGTDGLFGHGVSITLAGSRAGPGRPARVPDAHADRARHQPRRQARQRRRRVHHQRRQRRSASMASRRTTTSSTGAARSSASRPVTTGPSRRSSTSPATARRCAWSCCRSSPSRASTPRVRVAEKSASSKVTMSDPAAGA